MAIRELFRREGRRLYWSRLPDDRVSGRAVGVELEPERHYVVLRAAELFLGHSRVLWREFSPMLHVFAEASAGGGEHHGIVGPAQLERLGSVSAEQLLLLDTVAVGPMPYRGGDIGITVGLYSVPREDATAALIATVGALAGVVGGGPVPAGELLTVVKSGVEGVLGLNRTGLRLGVQDTVRADGPPTSGFHLGIAAPEAEVADRDFHVSQGRLRDGLGPLAKEYRGKDYVLVEVQAVDRREDWPGVPGLKEHNERFKEIMRDDDPVERKRERLSAAWGPFGETLRVSPDLTRHDAEAIEQDVGADIDQRLASLEAGHRRFEKRSWGSAETQLEDVADFDFVTVATVSG